MRIILLLVCLLTQLCYSTFGSINLLNEESPNSKIRKIQIDPVDSIKQKISFYDLQDSFELYYLSVRNLENLLIKQNRNSELYANDKYFDKLPANKEDSLSYRKALTYHANNLKNVLNDYYNSLTFLLESHNYVANDSLDNYAWYIEKIIGGRYARLNEYDKALYFYKMCIPNLEKGGKLKLLSRLYADIGDVYLWLEKYNSMHRYYRESINYGNQNNGWKGLQAVCENYSDFYMNFSDLPHEMKTDSVMHFISLSKQYLKKIKGDRSYNDRVRSTALNEGDLYALLQSPKAIKYYRKGLPFAIDTSTVKSRECAKIYHKIAKFYFENIKLDSCNQEIKNGFRALLPSGDKKRELPTKSEILFENTFTDLLLLKAKYYKQLYQNNSDLKYLDSCLISVDLAMVSNDQLHEKLLLNTSKYVSVSTNKEIIEVGISAAYLGYELSGDQKYWDASRSYYDKSKGNILNLNYHLNSAIDNFSKEKSDSIKTLKGLIFDLHRKFEFTDSDSLSGLLIEYSDQLKKQIKSDDLIELKSKHIENPYIEYVVMQSDYYMISNIDVNGIYKIGNRDSIDLKISKALSQISTKSSIINYSLLSELQSLLIPVSIDNIKSLTIIPDGLLLNFPFDVLRNDNEYLVSDVDISYRSSCVEIKNETNYNSIRPLFLLPRYSGKNKSEIAVDTKNTIGHLPFAKSEVKEIVSIFPQASMVSHTSNIDSIIGMFENYNVLHFAGHASSDADNSYLFFEDSNNGLVHIAINEIEQLYAPFDLVTLSACETGIGRFMNGEGVKSLSSAFQNSGAKSVLFSLWNVDDQSTEKIIGDFYKNINEGSSKDMSLSESKRSYLSNCTKENSHPYYWSGFIINGDLSPLTKRMSVINKALIVVGFSIFIFIFMYITKT